MSKPIYKIPSMSDIGNIAPNGRKVVSTFSGCGGSCLGYRMAGYEVVYANEFIPAAQDVYKLNHKKSFLDTRDIRQVKGSDILSKINLEVGQVDIFDGSPPCSNFSLAGKRQDSWGKVKKYSDTKQRVDDLFFEYLRLVDELKPKIFVAENVAAITTGVAVGYFKKIIEQASRSGYKVKCKIIDAQWLGVPQRRKRAIFIGVRDDLNVEAVYPKPFSYQYVVKDAFIGLHNKKKDALWLNKNTLTYKRWDVSKAGESHSQALKRLKKREVGFNQVKINPLSVSPTLTAQPQHYHWNEPRYLTISEIKRLASFPDDFQLSGSFNKQWERVGRSVPPMMMREISKTIYKEILQWTD